MGVVNARNLVLHFSLLYAEDTVSPKSPSFCSRCTVVRRAVRTLLHAEQRSSCACGFAEVDILSLFKRALQAVNLAGRLECQPLSSLTSI